MSTNGPDPSQPAGASSGPPIAAIVGLVLLSFGLGGLLIVLHVIGQPGGAVEATVDPGHPVHTKASRARMVNLGDFPAFQLTSHRGAKVDNATLAGHPYILHFFFACCDKSCPMMVQQIADLQKAHGDARARFVSITVDPQRDTPDTLAQHAERFADNVELRDISRWHLLTGKKFDLVRLLEDCRLPFPPNWKDDGPLGHVDKFLLVDAQGVLRGIYQYDDESQMAELSKDFTQLIATATAVESKPKGTE